MSGVAEDSVLMPHGSGLGNLVGMRMRVRSPRPLAHMHPVLVLRMGPACFLLLKLSHDHPTTCSVPGRGIWTLETGSGSHCCRGGACTWARVGFAQGAGQICTW